MWLFVQFDIATLVAILVLIFYSVIAMTIFLYRYSNIIVFYKNELYVLDDLLKKQKPSRDFYFNPCNGSRAKLRIMNNEAIKNLSEGLTWLSIIASTSPFIGLFGTVVSIYYTLISLNNSGGISQIASPIGHALIATACGIITAILSYTFYLILKRKIYECLNVLESQMNILENEK